MNSNQSLSIACRFFEEQDKLRGGPAPELCASDFRVAIGLNPVMDLEAYRQFSAGLYGAFPDLLHVIDDVVVQPGKEAIRFRVQGTHEASFMGIPPTGKKIDVPGLAIFEIVDGKAGKVDGVLDQAAMMRQLGVMPGA